MSTFFPLTENWKEGRNQNLHPRLLARGAGQAGANLHLPVFLGGGEGKDAAALTSWAEQRRRALPRPLPAHLSDAPLEVAGDVGGCRELDRALHPSQVERGAQVEALTLPGGRPLDGPLLVHLQGAVFVQALGRHLVPLPQGQGLVAPEYGGTCEGRPAW